LNKFKTFSKPQADEYKLLKINSKQFNLEPLSIYENYTKDLKILSHKTQWLLGAMHDPHLFRNLLTWEERAIASHGIYEFLIEYINNQLYWMEEYWSIT
jgi:hypothetical protein